MDKFGPEQVTRLWEEHSAALVLYAQQWCDAPDDVVQEAFLILVHQIAAPDNPVGWLYRVVRNRSINAARSSGRRNRRESAVAAQAESWFERTDSDRLDADEVAKALVHLPIAEREVIVARIWGGLSLEEVAQLTGTSISTAHRCYQRGIAALRERFSESCLKQIPKNET